MKKTTLFLIILFISVSAFSQDALLSSMEEYGISTKSFNSGNGKKLIKETEDLYRSDAYLMSNLIISRSVYNPENDSNITSVEFYQDTTKNANAVYVIYAEISKRDGFDNDYSIGSIYDYQTDIFGVSVIIKTYFADGTFKITNHKIHFDSLPLPSEEIKSVEYYADPSDLDDLPEGVVLL
jgi:hypothetical protein